MDNKHSPCPVTLTNHHYHTDKGPQFYVGAHYVAVCCHCGRTQAIIYRGHKETTDLTMMQGEACGPYLRQ